eukprot:ANDGO_01345.mRNA.1 hypothetical protein
MTSTHPILSKEDISFLTQTIRGNGAKETLAFAELYASPKDSLNSSVYHTKCNNKGAQLCVLKLNNGAMLGGYTSVGPNGSSGAWLPDAKAFLFVLRNASGSEHRLSYPVTVSQHAFLDNATYGPTFGAGHELLIFQNTSWNVSGQSNSYKHSNGNSDFWTILKSSTPNAVYVFEATVVTVPPPAPPPTISEPFAHEELDKDIDLKVHCEELRESLRHFLHRERAKLGIDRINILLVGHVGAGKSSFVSTIDSCAKYELVLSQLSMASQSTSVSKTLVGFNVGAEEEGTFPFRLWDTMGYEDEDDPEYYEKLGLILDGKLKSGTRLDQSPIPASSMNSSPSVVDRMHVMCVCASAEDAENVDYCKRIGKLTNYARRRCEGQLHVCIVITKIDKYDQDLLKTAASTWQCYSSARLAKLRESIGKHTGLNLNSLYVVRCYSSEYKTYPAIDCVAMNVLLDMKPLIRGLFDNWLSSGQYVAAQKSAAS